MQLGPGIPRSRTWTPFELAVVKCRSKRFAPMNSDSWDRLLAKETR